MIKFMKELEAIRDEISSLIREKESDLYVFSNIDTNDFQFIKCVNRRLRVPDGKPVYDGEGLKSVYRSGSIYVRLTKPFDKVYYVNFMYSLYEFSEHNVIPLDE